MPRTLETISQQTYANFELIIVDDASTDTTWKVVAEYMEKDPRIRYFKNEQNLKIARSLNYGLRQARGMYIARADDDDPWIDIQKLEKQIAFLEKNSDYALVGTGAIVIDESGKELFRYLQPETDSDIRKKILFINPFTHPSVVFRKSIIEKTGLYDENALDVEDWDLWLRIGRQGKFHNLPIYGVNRFYGERGISIKNKKSMAKSRLLLTKKYKNQYPGFFFAYLFNLLQRVYSLSPHQHTLHNILLRLKRTTFGK